MTRTTLLILTISILVPLVAFADEFRDAERAFESAFTASATAKDRLDAIDAVSIFDTKDAAKLLLSGVEVADRILAPMLEEKLEVDREIEKALAGQIFDNPRELPKEKDAEVKRLKRRSAELQAKIDGENKVLAAIEESLGRMASKEVVEYLAENALSREKHWKARLIVANVLARSADESVDFHLVRALREKDERVLIAVISAVGERKIAGALKNLLKLLREDRWTVRSAAIGALGDIAVKEAVGPLIEQMEKEEGRLRQDCADALTKLTGQRFGDSPELWKRWWEEHKEEYGGDAGKPLGGHPPDRGGDPGRGYYGVPVQTNKAIFILDVSGSMAKSAKDPNAEPGPGNPSKIEVAKGELTRVIDNFDPKGRLNLIVFNDIVKRWKNGMVPATRANKDAGKAWVKNLEAASSTNIYDALQSAFEVAGMGARDKYYEPGADTIFLLSDGSPTTPDGQPDDWEKILRAVAEWNKLGRIKIHAIGVGGHNVAFMSRLASENGGRYVAR